MDEIATAPELAQERIELGGGAFTVPSGVPGEKDPVGADRGEGEQHDAHHEERHVEAFDPAARQGRPVDGRVGPHQEQGVGEGALQGRSQPARERLGAFSMGYDPAEEEREKPSGEVRGHDDREADQELAEARVRRQDHVEKTRWKMASTWVR